MVIGGRIRPEAWPDQWSTLSTIDKYTNEFYSLGKFTLCVAVELWVVKRGSDTDDGQQAILEKDINSEFSQPVMKSISTKSVCRGTLVAAVVLGWLGAGSGAAEETITGEIDVQVIHGSDAGSEEIQAGLLLTDRPRKRPIIAELASADFARPKRRSSLFTDLDSNLPEIIAILKRPPVPGQYRVLDVSVPKRNTAVEPPGIELTNDQFSGLLDVAVTADADAGSDGSVGPVMDPPFNLDARIGTLQDGEAVALAEVGEIQLHELGDLGTRPRRRPVSIDELVCLADVMYFEARGETAAGRHAVAMTVLNRVSSRRFPDTICGVVTQGKGELHRCQFSYYCDGRPELVHELEAYREIKDMARVIIETKTADVTGGATFFHTVYVSPAWADYMQKTATIGRHVFYRERN